jgi:hypothetical protein
VEVHLHLVQLVRLLAVELVELVHQLIHRGVQPHQQVRM